LEKHRRNEVKRGGKTHNRGFEKRDSPSLERGLQKRDTGRKALLPVNEIEDKPEDLWPRNEDTTWRRFVTLQVVPESQCDLDNEAGNPLEQDDNHSNLGNDPGIIDSPDLWLAKNTEISLCRGVGPLGSRTNGFQLLMPICPSDDLSKEPRELLDGYMLREPMIVHPVRAIRCIPDECRIL